MDAVRMGGPHRIGVVFFQYTGDEGKGAVPRLGL